MVLTSALCLVSAGLAIGVPIALWTQRVAHVMVEGLPSDTAFPIDVAAAAILGVGLLAAYFPARRAARVQPIEVLRHS